ncbi:hypothetical protein M0805_007561 [Coniferiporia weirii]|nr:hypothetical protein M0805_007561 [Coniferiporia weirii]
MAAFKGILQRLRMKSSDHDGNTSLDSTEEKLESSSIQVVESSFSPSAHEDKLSVNLTPDIGVPLVEGEEVNNKMGRHLGVFSCTLLIVGRVIGTGIFSTPSSILASAGSVGASLVLWVLVSALSYCGLCVWLELGTMFPRSGGEKVYLETVYARPKMLATVFYATQAIILGFTAAGGIVFAQNILVSAGQEAGRWSSRGIAIGVIVFTTLIHGVTPKAGVWLMNVLSVSKILILILIIVTGWVVLAGQTHIKDSRENFRDAFAGSSHSSTDYADATFKVLSAYGGWSNINYVMGEVKDPVRTLKIAGPLGLGICVVLYMFANIAYFAAVTKEEIINSGTTVASQFFEKVYGEKAQKALSVFVALRCAIFREGTQALM